VRKGGSKQKGSTYERKICWALSRFVDPSGTETHFWRAAMSGGRATLQNRKGIENRNQIGDITCISEKGMWFARYACECKHYADLDIVSFLFKRRGKLAAFWNKLKKEAEKAEKLPLLIAKENRLPTLALTTESGKEYLERNGHRMPVVLLKFGGVPANDIYVCLFDDVFGG